LNNELPARVRAILDDPAALETMRANMRALARPQAADEIARELTALAEEKKS